MRSHVRAAVAAFCLIGCSPVAWSATYQSMAFGYPGQPNDGVQATAPDPRLDLDQPFSLAGAEAGLVITAFGEGLMPFVPNRAFDLIGVGLVPADESCTIAASYRYKSVISVNHGTGVYLRITGEELQQLAAHSAGCDGGPYSLGQLSIRFVNVGYTGEDGSRQFVQVLDALSIDLATPENLPYRALTDGDPGVPGDGIVVKNQWDGYEHFLAPAISLVDATDGVTMTVFRGPQSPPASAGGLDGVSFYVQTPAGDCWIGGWEPFDGTVTVNGVTGGHAFLSQERLNEFVAIANGGCGARSDLTVADLHLRGFQSGDWIDAVAVTPGPDGYPGGGGTPSVDLSVDVVDDRDPALTGEHMSYYVTVRNNGPSTVVGVDVALQVEGLTNVWYYEAAGWLCDAQLNRCRFHGAIEAGAEQTFRLSGNARATPGTMRVGAHVSSATPDPVTANDVDTETTQVELPPSSDVHVALVPDRSSVMAGETMTFTIEVGNAGHSESLAYVAFNPHPDGEVLSIAGAGWSCDPGARTCQSDTLLAAGATSSIVVEYRVPAYETEMLTSVTVDGSWPDPDLNNNYASAQTSVRQCTAEDYADSTVTPQYVINRNKVMVKATVSTPDCGERSQKITVR